MKQTRLALVFGLWAGCLAAADYIPSNIVESGPAAERRQALETEWVPQPQHQMVINYRGGQGDWAIFVFYRDPDERKAVYIRPDPQHLARHEVRSGRDRDHFVEIDRRAIAEGKELLALHIFDGPNGKIYSGIWVETTELEYYRALLLKLGITPAARIGAP